MGAILVFSETFDQHLKHRGDLFETLDINNLKLKSAKCKFFSSEVTYLGHVVSEDGIKTNPEKLTVLCDWPVTSCIR